MIERLQIYKDAYLLTGKIYDAMPQMEKLHRYTIGSKILDSSLDMFKWITMANKARGMAKERIPPTERDIARINSYLGFMVAYNSYAIRRELALVAIQREGLSVTSKFKKVELSHKHKYTTLLEDRLTKRCLNNKRKRNGKNN